MRIVIDTREQLPFHFQHQQYEGVKVERGTLPTGDYSLAGLTDKAAVERKSLDDLIGCLTKGRGRFEAELNRARGLDMFAVICEGSWLDIARHNYKSRMLPHAAMQSIVSFMLKYDCPFILAGTRQGAEYLTYSLLRQYLEGSRKRLDAIIKAHGAAQEGL